MRPNPNSSLYRLDMNQSMLVGYVRRSNAGGEIKVSINVDAFEECEKYTTADGQTYVALRISLNALNKVLVGERVVTTITQTNE